MDYHRYQYAIDTLLLKPDGREVWIPYGVCTDLESACYQMREGGAANNRWGQPILALRYRKYWSDDVWVLDEDRSNWPVLTQRDMRRLAREWARKNPSQS